MLEDDMSQRLLFGYTKLQWIECTGPCLLTFSVPLLIPGVSLTVVAFTNPDVFARNVFMILGILFLVFSFIFFSAGFIVCLVNNSKASSRVGIIDMSLMRDYPETRIYLGSTFHNEPLGNEGKKTAANGQLVNTKETKNKTIRNFKTPNSTVPNGVYVKNKQGLFSQSKQPMTTEDSKSHGILKKSKPLTLQSASDSSLESRGLHSPVIPPILPSEGTTTHTNNFRIRPIYSGDT